MKLSTIILAITAAVAIPLSLWLVWDSEPVDWSIFPPVFYVPNR